MTDITSRWAHKISRAFYRALSCAAVAAFAAVAGAVVPTPSVIGPLASDTPGTPGRNYPFFSTDMVLADFGYVD